MKLKLSLLLAIFVGAACEFVFADTTAQDGLWSENTTWADGTPPTVLDDANIADTHDIVVDSDGICSNFYLPSGGGGTATLVVTNSACITNAGLTYIGNNGNGKLTIRSGLFENSASLDSAARLGNAEGALGEIEISGGTLKLSGTGVNTSMLIGNAAGATGIVNQTGGTVQTAKSIITGYATGSVGIYNMSDGNLNILDRYFYAGNNGYGEFNLSGGTVTHSGTAIMADRAGSTGIVNQTGGSWHVSGEFTAKLGDSTYNLEGGELTIGDDLRLASAGSGIATLRISGGSLDVMYARYCHGGYATIHIIGSGCTNINFRDTLDMYLAGTTSNSIIRAHIDGTPQGISLIKVAGDVDLENVTFEFGITNDFNHKSGDYFEFVRVPEINSINTNGIAVSNLTEGYEFEPVVSNYSSYNWLLIKCTKYRPQSTCILLK